MKFNLTLSQRTDETNDVIIKRLISLSLFLSLSLSHRPYWFSRGEMRRLRDLAITRSAFLPGGDFIFSADSLFQRRPLPPSFLHSRRRAAENDRHGELTSPVFPDVGRRYVAIFTTRKSDSRSTN